MRIAIVGMGEVGRCYAKALYAAGHELILCEAFPSPAARELASQWSLELHQQPGVCFKNVHWVFSCVTGAQALAVVEQVAAFLDAGTGFADLTTASPETKKQAFATARAAGFEYVDVAIMGAISLNWEKTPLLAAGRKAADFREVLLTANGRVQVIEGVSPGAAISLKILRSIFTKGMEALAVELLMSAEKQGVREELYHQLKDIDETPLRSFIDMLVRTHVIHAKRRAHEVHDARRELDGQGLPSLVLPGVEERFNATAALLERRPLDVDNPDVGQALTWLLAAGDAT